MRMFMTITDIKNVDYDNKKVIDNNNLKEIDYDWEEDIMILDTIDNKQKPIKVSRVSLFDHRLMLDNKTYHILHALSK